MYNNDQFLDVQLRKISSGEFPLLHVKYDFNDPSTRVRPCMRSRYVKLAG